MVDDFKQRAVCELVRDALRQADIEAHTGPRSKEVEFKTAEGDLVTLTVHVREAI